MEENIEKICNKYSRESKKIRILSIIVILINKKEWILKKNFDYWVMIFGVAA